MREVEVQTEVFITLKSQFEITQIEEVDDTKMIEVLDWPEKPLNRVSPRKESLSAFIGLLLGFIIGIILIFIKRVFRDYRPLIKF